MKIFRRSVCLLLILAMLLCDCSVQAYAGVGDGKTLATAVDLTLGKTKTARIDVGQQSAYFNVLVSDIGKLKITLTADKIGTDVEVEVFKNSSDLVPWRQTKTLAYNKSKKKVSGGLTSEYLLTKGVYAVRVTPKKNLKSTKKVKIKAQMVGTGYENMEPNNSEENAQPMDVSGKGGVRKYKMLISNISTLSSEIPMDCFTFRMKGNASKQFQLNVSLKERVDGLSVLVCKDTPEGITVLHRYDMTGKTLNKKLKIDKGTYYVKVWYNGGKELQIPYTISGTVIK